MMLSVIVPTFNRLENLKLCLAAIQNQKDAPFFELVIVDDGSTDNTLEWLREEFVGVDSDSDVGSMRTISDYNIPVRILKGGPNKGFRGGRARNLGAFNSYGDRFVFIDSDIVLNENALRAYQDADVAQPDAIIVGRYFVLPKIMPIDSVLELVCARSAYQSLMDDLTKTATVEIDFAPEGMVWRWGEDLGGRPESDYTDDVNSLRTGAGLGGLSGNISYPRSLFYSLGGFDEMMVGHGGEDADLGLTADEHEAKWLFYKPIFGWHIWHHRNQQANNREVQANIAYIDAKHGVGMYANAEKWSDSQDWASPVHYHKHLGARLVKTTEGPAVWAVREGNAIKLSSPKWLGHLGFVWEDVQIVPASFLGEMKYWGDAIWETSVREVPKEVVAATEDKQPSEVPIRAPAFDITKETNFKKTEGSGAFRTQSDATVYVVRGSYRVALSHPDAMLRLGFGFEEVKIVPDYAFDNINVVGVAGRDSFDVVH